MKASIFLFLAASIFVLSSCSKTEFEEVQTKITVLEKLETLNSEYGELVPVQYDFSKTVLQGLKGDAYYYSPKNNENKQNLFVLVKDNAFAKGIPEQSWYGTLVVQEFGSGYLIGCAGDADNCMEVEVDGRTWIVTH
jgi:hypothetical protein